MASDEAWPPLSARQALLSSPSGRQRYADFQSGLASSPIKRSTTTPSLVDRLRLARNNQDHMIIQNREDEEDEEDEETLQLKLAAIEAKLKLRKLQNRKRDDELQSSSRPQSVGSVSATMSANFPQVEITMSPTKRIISAAEQRSPSRFILGIDKGVRGADVSLRRARIDHSPSKKARSTVTSDIRPSSHTTHANTSRTKNVMPTHTIKSFSERMSETRDQEQKQLNKRESAYRERTKRFKIDQTEIESFKVAAEARAQTRSQSPVRAGVSSSNTEKANHDVEETDGLKKIQTFAGSQKPAGHERGDSTLFEGFSGLHLSSRILPHSFLKRQLPDDQFNVYRVPDLLRDVTSPTYEIPDEVGDFVVFGVIASKSSPLDQKSRVEDKTKSSDQWQKKWDDGSQNRKKFMVFTVTDLKWTVDLYLFDTAVPRYHRLTPGTVIAVLNPAIMPPKKGREDTGAFSLALHNGEDTVLEIGTSQHLGFCNAKKKDGHECGSWVDSSKSEICEWHLNAQITRTQASRMGVNTGMNGFGAPKVRSHDLPAPSSKKQGRGFDWETGSHYYMASSSDPAFGTRAGPPKFRTEVSTARMLDYDDPFIAEGQFSRNKEAILQKRMATQEKERQIAKRLANSGDGTSAGADYMMRKANGDVSGKPRDGRRHDLTNKTPYDPGKPREQSSITGLEFRSEIGRKRPAQDVRLSPVKKKTRFMTSAGIKEAGRESTGFIKPRDESDDDDLDII